MLVPFSCILNCLLAQALFNECLSIRLSPGRQWLFSGNPRRTHYYAQTLRMTMTCMREPSLMETEFLEQGRRPLANRGRGTRCVAVRACLQRIKARAVWRRRRGSKASIGGEAVDRERDDGRVDADLSGG